MQRINSTNRAVNKFGAGKDGFQGGSTATGVKATYVTPEWTNAVQEELARAIEGAGIALDAAKHDQLLAAIKSIAWGAGKNSAPWATEQTVAQKIVTDRPYEATVANIKMSGTQAVGTSNAVARGDHVHPTDTSRVAKAGDTMTGHLKTRYVSEFVGFTAENPTEGKSAFFDAEVNGVIRGSLQIKPAVPAGEYGAHILVTPPGSTSVDRRIVGLEVYQGGLRTPAYGWLHDKFAARDGSTAMTAPLYVQGGAGGGIVSDIDRDTGILFPSDGVRQDYVNGKLSAEYNANENVTRFINESGHNLALQSDGNLVYRGVDNNVVWDAFSSAKAAKRWTSPDFTAPISGALITINHPLGEIPYNLCFYLRCTKADAGYSVGDVLFYAGESNTNGDNEGFGWKVTATQIIVRVGLSAFIVDYTHGTTGGAQALRRDSWSIFIKAGL